MKMPLRRDGDSEGEESMRGSIFGIDIGSVSISVVALRPDKVVIRTDYRLHQGRIRETLVEMLKGFALHEIASIAATASTPGYINAAKRYDNQVAVMSTARHLHGSVRSILNVGAEKFSLILFDENGNYHAGKTNTSCAAGTGSFLDQQALRLNFKNIGDLSLAALRNLRDIPKIASRCAVFAKTDLIHAQQEGYSLEEICDGLCHGLAKNIVDTLFTGADVKGTIIFCGGVSKNCAVKKHIGALTGAELTVDDFSPVYGAMGAALRLLEEGSYPEISLTQPEDIIIALEQKRSYAFAGLDLRQSQYPDFSGGQRYEYRIGSRTVPEIVEVDVYDPLPGGGPIHAFFGVDIGSTSTKAVLTDSRKNVLAGLYTRTAGRPVDAMCAILEALDDLAARKHLDITFLGSGTTGSGRKLMGGIIGADLVIDEISAHARAAYELSPDVDTIIEIGGQDSKFTTLKKGMVNFSVMNTVCAAGTGSFIEEQARKMGCPLSEYSQRTMGMQAPASSDRCTVFMERDMNYHLSEGFSANEVLASALHSVCENYLTKVAIESMIGEKILFQGATAKNKALVAAFEQRLKKPVTVSRFCHLTGALGVALMLADENVKETKFHGLGLYKKHIPVRSEVCGICPNHCKLTIASIEEKSLAYGFLCGRDYETKGYVDNNRSGFDLLKARKKAASFPKAETWLEGITIGIPAALHLYEDLEFWQYFFNKLSIRTVTSAAYRDALKEGRNIAGADFCAPLTALHGHVRHLMDRCDYVFAPVYLEDRQKERHVRSQYCYYTQYAPSLVSEPGKPEGEKVLMPLIQYLYNRLHTKYQLYHMLRRITADSVSFLEVSQAYDKALAYRDAARKSLQDLCAKEMENTEGIQVMLLGRPYTVLSPSMNKGIIDIFASKGVKVFFQDMLDPDEDLPGFVKQLADDLPWKYASTILRSTQSVAKKKGVYPVLVTSFRCSPDSLVMEYFKKLMNSLNKPYLILQLDEHDSSVGYETRIEAAIRSFTNHYGEGLPKSPDVFTGRIPRKLLSDRTLLMPNWDRFSCSLIAASLRAEGMDARLLEDTRSGIQEVMRHNSGQCIPINIIAQETIDYIKKYRLDPAKCMVWIGGGEIACNLKVIPHHIRNILDAYGSGMEKVEIYQGEVLFLDISVRAAMDAYFSFMFGGMLRKIGCRMRPYEREEGSVDKALDKCLSLFIDAFSGGGSKEDALVKAVDLLKRIPLSQEYRPKVAIFGDLYVRDNDAANQDLIRYIEKCGAEVITTPYSTYAKMIASPYFKKWIKEGKYLHTLSAGAMFMAMTALEKRYERHFQSLLGEHGQEFNDSQAEILAQYNLLPEHTGESMDNILKIHYIKKHYPDVSLFVHTSPAFCCPALITEAMAGRIEEVTGVPVVCVTYDGTFGDKNAAVIPYLAFPKERWPDNSAKDRRHSITMRTFF